MSDRIIADKGLAVRHNLLELLEHWSIAISGLLLTLTGIFELPIAKRYYVTEIPGFSWSGDFITSLTIHYAAAVVFTAACLFHVVYHGLRGDRGMIPRKGDLTESAKVIKTFFGLGKEPPFHKYLPEQRLAYAGMAFIIAMLILSGLIKTYKNIYDPQMSITMTLWATWVHNVFFILFLLAFFAHIAAIVIKPNRPMLRGIFTGAVKLDYARERHPLWVAEMEAEPSSSWAATLHGTGETTGDYSTFTEPDTTVVEHFVPLSDGAAIRVTEFIPSRHEPGRPVVVFVAGWISLITGWTGVLKKLTPSFRTLYVETREKISARLPESKKICDVDFSVSRITADIHAVLERFVPEEQPFYFVGSSLGSTVVLDYLSQGLRQCRLAVMIAPNPAFPFPSWGIPLIRYAPASLYGAAKPAIKWYLRNVRLDKKKEPEQVKKYEGTMDAAEPRRLQANALALSTYSLWDKLPHITAPVIIVGATADKLHGIREMERMVELMPSARLEMMASNKETHSEKAGIFIVDEITRLETAEPEEGKTP
ncbi:MAG: alpha/beta fold hydrolase [Deltaproteobacteria bacterium]|nr:alpha/beta fold hydrolase [Deltaproteobacteria bacterium]